MTSMAANGGLPSCLFSVLGCSTRLLDSNPNLDRELGAMVHDAMSWY